jgi:hypothetical protein
LEGHVESSTLLGYVREDLKRVEDGLRETNERLAAQINACTKQFAELQSQREANDRFMERLTKMATLVVLIGHLVLPILTLVAPILKDLR